jgi:very-short-patch-repair endonuclease
MDFLILFSKFERIVIEVDGKQHYSEADVASPKKYSEMVAEDRKLRLAGYELYRFGGYELQGQNGEKIIEEFFKMLMEKHRIKIK